MEALTPKQQRIAAFIRKWQAERGYPPSIREVAAFCGIQAPAAAQHLKALEKKGVLTREPHKKRCLTLTMPTSETTPVRVLPSPPPQPPLQFRLVGTIPAGVPLSAEEHPEDVLYLTPEWFGRGEMIALRVQGDSMEGDAIVNGDIAIIKLQTQARAHEIAAVRVDRSEVTLKRVRIQDGIAELIPSNPEYQVRCYPAEQVEIIGVLEGLIRRRRV